MSKPSDRQPTFFAYLYQLYHICLCVFYIFSLSIYSFVRLVRPLFAVVQGSIRGLTVQSCRSTFQIQILMHENARPITAPSQATNPKIRRVRKSLQKSKMSHSSSPQPPPLPKRCSSPPSPATHSSDLTLPHLDPIHSTFALLPTP